MHTEESLMELAKECTHKLANEANWHGLRLAIRKVLAERDMALRDAAISHERWHLACNDYADMKERAERAEEERDERPTKRLWDETATALETLRVKFHNVNAECERNRKLLREWRSLFPGMSVEPGSLRDRTDSAMQEGK